ncbi:MAG: rod shape-determining protein RodA [Bacteroidales bacterium]|nr:rod shape-determining protein RodA [Bacteroidales bacterium]
MTRNKNIFRRIDRISAGIFLLMIIMGWFNIYAAVYNEEHSGLFDFTQRYGKQFVWIIATVVLAVFTIIIDNRFYFFFAWFIYGLTIFLLIMVLLVGNEINGAKSWFEIGSFTFQPSEFAKTGTALALASYMNLRKNDLKRFGIFIPAIAIIAFPAILVALQPDMGSATVFFALFLVLFREGMNPYFFYSGIIMVILFFFTLLFNNLYLSLGIIAGALLIAYILTRNWKLCLTGLLILVLAGSVFYMLNRFVIKSLSNEMVVFIAVIVSGAIFSLYSYYRRAVRLFVVILFLLGSLAFVNSVDFTFNNLVKPHQKERVEIMLGFKSDPHGTGYNVNQSIISIGSGGLTGKGYLRGTQTKFKFVPAQSTDFIFCTVGEEWGFMGSIVVIGLYMALLIRLIILAERQRSVFSRVYGYSVVSVIFFHYMVNIGMTIGLVPVIGIPLPFFSYGGSSLWGFTVLLFIFLRLDASRTEYLV